MEWKDLSIDAKNVLEMVDPPYGTRPVFLKVANGELFNRFGANVFITDEIFKEIILFCEDDKYLAIIDRGENYISIKESKYL